MANKISVVILWFFLFTNYSLASIKPLISINSFKYGLNDPNYKYLDKYNFINGISSINYGISYFDESYSITISSNRFLNFYSKSNVENKNNKLLMLSKIKVESDTLNLNYYIDRFSIGSSISNVNVKKQLFYKGNKVGEKENNTFVYSLNTGYFITKNIQTNLNYVLPNKELNLIYGIGIGINYIF